MPATTPLWLIRLDVTRLEQLSAHSDHFKAMGCRIEGDNDVGRNGRHPGETVLTVGGIAASARGSWDTLLQPAAAAISWGRLGVSVISGGRRSQA